LKRLLLPSTAFIRSARRLARQHPAAARELETVLALLAEDAFHPQLRTHKLKGKLSGSWASSAGYDRRVVFQFVMHKVRSRSCSKVWVPMTKFTEHEGAGRWDGFARG